MQLNEVLKTVPSRWHEEFRRFVNTGEAESAFLAFLDSNAECQTAVETVFEEQSKALEALAAGLRSAPTDVEVPSTTVTVSTDLARALQETILLPKSQRVRVIELAKEAVQETAPSDKRDEVEREIAAVGESLASA